MHYFRTDENVFLSDNKFYYRNPHSKAFLEAKAKAINAQEGDVFGASEINEDGTIKNFIYIPADAARIFEPYAPRVFETFAEARKDALTRVPALALALPVSELLLKMFGPAGPNAVEGPELDTNALKRLQEHLRDNRLEKKFLANMKEGIRETNAEVENAVRAHILEGKPARVIPYARIEDCALGVNNSIFYWSADSDFPYGIENGLDEAMEGDTFGIKVSERKGYVYTPYHNLQNIRHEGEVKKFASYADALKDARAINDRPRPDTPYVRTSNCKIDGYEVFLKRGQNRVQQVKCRYGDAVEGANFGVWLSGDTAFAYVPKAHAGKYELGENTVEFPSFREAREDARLHLAEIHEATPEKTLYARIENNRVINGCACLKEGEEFLVVTTGPYAARDGDIFGFAVEPDKSTVWLPVSEIEKGKYEYPAQEIKAYPDFESARAEALGIVEEGLREQGRDTYIAVENRPLFMNRPYLTRENRMIEVRQQPQDAEAGQVFGVAMDTAGVVWLPLKDAVNYDLAKVEYKEYPSFAAAREDALLLAQKIADENRKGKKARKGMRM